MKRQHEKKSARNDFWETALFLTGFLLALAFLAFPVKFAVVVVALLKVYYIFTTTR